PRGSTPGRWTGRRDGAASSHDTHVRRRLQRFSSILDAVIPRFWSEASPAQRSAFLAAWLGWVLDAFDFTLFLLVMPDVGRELHLGGPELGPVVTAALLGRVGGGPIGGWLCDRFGRRRPMMAALVLYALFDTLVAFASSYRGLLALRFLFGLGMGAEWSAG